MFDMFISFQSELHNLQMLVSQNDILIAEAGKQSDRKVICRWAKCSLAKATH